MSAYKLLAGTLMCLAAAAGLAAEVKPQVSVAIEEIVSLSKAGVDVATIETFVKSFQARFRPQAADILYMHQNGVSAAVINTMIVHEPAPAEPYPEPRVVYPTPDEISAATATRVKAAEDRLYPSFGIGLSLALPPFGFSMHHRIAGPFRFYQHR